MKIFTHDTLIVPGNEMDLDSNDLVNYRTRFKSSGSSSEILSEHILHMKHE